MYAIIATGGKQYKVEPGKIIQTEIIPLKKEGDIILFDKVLLFNDGKETQIGTPYLEDIAVEGKIQKELKGEKLIAFKYRSKERYRRKVGHRQKYTEVLIKEIAIAGNKMSEKKETIDTAVKQKNPVKNQRNKTAAKLSTQQIKR